MRGEEVKFDTEYFWEDTSAGCGNEGREEASVTMLGNKWTVLLSVHDSSPELCRFLFRGDETPWVSEWTLSAGQTRRDHL